MDLNGAHQEDSTVFHCSHIYTRMLDFLSIAFIIYFPAAFPFPCGKLLQYFVYLVLIVIVFSKLINHNYRIKNSVCIHHIVSATVVNTYV
jgi:hypothetical protein